MPPGNNEADGGEFNVFISQPVSVEVSLKVVNADKGQVMSQRRRLGRVHPHQQRTRQARPDGDGNAGEVCPANVSLGHGLFHYGDDGEQVLAGSHLGDNPTVAGVDFHLRGNRVGEHFSAIRHHRRRRLVAGGLDS